MEDYTSASGRLIRMIVSLVASAGAATFRETFAEALELPVNTYFSCSQSGSVRLYKRISAAPGYRDLGDTAANLFAETAKTYRDQSLEATSEAAAHAMSSSSYAAVAAALLNGMLFTTDAAGVAAVDDGAPFVLQGDGEDGVFGRLKRRVGAAAVDQGISLPALPIPATGIADTAEKVIMTAAERGALYDLRRYSPLETLHAADYDLVIISLDGQLSSTIPDSNEVSAGAGYVETLHAAGGAAVTLDRQGRAVQTGPAQQPPSDISARVASVVDDAGIPVGGVLSGWQLHYTRSRIRRLADLKAGTYNAVTNIAPSAAQLVLAFPGDSYTQGIPYYIGRLAQRLLALCGDAGVGWIGFAWFSGATGTWTTVSQPAGKDTTARFREAVNKVDVIGTWTCTYNDPALNTPSLSCVSSSTAGDYVTWDFTAGHNACNLFYTGDGTGVVAVSWDDGATYGANISLATVGASNVALTGVPAGAATARVKVISGNVKIAGVDMQSANSGVRIHKLGASGSRAQHWASVTPAWRAQLAALAPDLVSMPIGANDQGSARSAVQFKADLTTIRANVRAVLPYADLLFQAQPENARTTNVYPMSAYRAAMAAMVLEAGDAAMLDHQYFWGPPDNNAVFYYNTSRKWLDTTQMLHPEGDGQYAMTDAIWRLLTAQI